MRFVSDRAIAITAAMVGLGMALSACSLPPGAPMPGVKATRLVSSCRHRRFLARQQPAADAGQAGDECEPRPDSGITPPRPACRPGGRRR